MPRLGHLEPATSQGVISHYMGSTRIFYIDVIGTRDKLPIPSMATRTTCELHPHVCPYKVTSCVMNLAGPPLRYFFVGRGGPM